MALVPVRPDDADLIAAVVEIRNAGRLVDDPDALEAIPELVSRELRYGWDLDPGETYLYVPDGGGAAVGVLDVDPPTRDNLQVVWAGIVVHPEHRRQGHGSAMMQDVIRRTRQLGRSIIWMGTAEDDTGARRFLEGSGFAYASQDARRRQVLADVNTGEVDRLHAMATQAARDYQLVRQVAPTPDSVLAELVAVTAAINDAPSGDLAMEDERFDLQRLKDVETANAGVGNILYRTFARHRETGEVGGHTVVVTNPLRPQFGGQGDTAVRREHRGHRLGLLLKIEMMRWLAEVEPQLEVIETWNQVDNRFMIAVNESIGYRLNRTFVMYQRMLH